MLQAFQFSTLVKYLNMDFPELEQNEQFCYHGKCSYGFWLAYISCCASYEG